MEYCEQSAVVLFMINYIVREYSSQGEHYSFLYVKPTSNDI